MWKARTELSLAVLFAAAAIATAIWPTWLESLTGLDPDGGSGETEWWLVALLGVAAVVSGLVARRSFAAIRRVPPALDGPA